MATTLSSISRLHTDSAGGVFGIAHGDVCLPNVRLNMSNAAGERLRECEVKLIDLGLGSLRTTVDYERSNLVSRSMGIKGEKGRTAHVAPKYLDEGVEEENARENDIRERRATSIKKPGLSADIFAFGVTAWEVLTGGEPWKGKSTAEVAAAVARGKRLNINRKPNGPVSPETPECVIKMLDKCMAFYRNDPQRSILAIR